MSIEIKRDDVVKLILQYCKENGLPNTFRALQEESHITLNTVDSIESFSSDIRSGRWDAVLRQMSNIKIQASKLMDLYETVALELLEIGENETAMMLFKETPVAQQLRTEFPERCMKLDHLSAKATFDLKDAYSTNISKEKRRKQLAEKIVQEVSVVAPSRLLALLGQSLKYQESLGILKPNIKFDIFTGEIPTLNEEEEKYPTTIEKTLKYSEATRIECMAFAHSGQFLVTGSVDGIIEVWEPLSGKLKADFTYQTEEAFMLHSVSVLSLAISKDNEILASGDKSGVVKVWRLSTGKCLRKFDQVHSKSITCIKFGKDITHLLTGSHEIKVLGLKSGKIIKEFRGHQSYVNDFLFIDNGSKLVSGSSDGFVKFWDYTTSECLMNFKPPSDKPGCDLDIYTLIYAGNNNVIICNKSNVLHLVNFQGNVVKTYVLDKKNVEFVCACTSMGKMWLYGVGNDNYLYSFNMNNGKLEHLMKLSDSEILGIVQHPHRNLLVSYAMNGEILFLAPS